MLIGNTTHRRGGFKNIVPNVRVLPKVALLQLKLINKTKIYIMKNSNDENFNATFGNTMLCDGFLIPMTDFVLEQLNEQNSRTKPMREVFNSLEKYAKFLKQPLKLEMFVPCNENRNVLEEPQMRPERNSFDEEDMDYDAQELYDYIKAKEKVLFELNSPLAVETMIYHISRNRNIEYLANFGSIKLTQNSLNAIFG